MLCFCCWEFGHTRARCQQQNQPTCGHCSEKHEVSTGNNCTTAAFCKRCNSNDHPLSSRKCPTYTKEEEIQHLRVDMGISYPAARRHHEARNNPRSMAAVFNASQEQRFAELSAKMDAVLADNKKKEEENKAKDEMLLKFQEALNKQEERIANLMVQLAKRDDEIAAKDVRIQRLEAAKSIPPQQRMEVAKEHGTIPNLLEEVRSLKEIIASKDKEILSLLNTQTSPGNATNVMPPQTGKRKEHSSPTHDSKKNSKMIKPTTLRRSSSRLQAALLKASPFRRGLTTTHQKKTISKPTRHHRTDTEASISPFESSPNDVNQSFVHDVDLEISSDDDPTTSNML